MVHELQRGGDQEVGRDRKPGESESMGRQDAAGGRSRRSYSSRPQDDDKLHATKGRPHPIKTWKVTRKDPATEQRGKRAVRGDVEGDHGGPG